MGAADSAPQLVDLLGRIQLFTGLSPSAHAASTEADPSPGWWQRMIGPGLAIDTRRYFVVCVNSLGSLLQQPPNQLISGFENGSAHQHLKLGHSLSVRG